MPSQDLQYNILLTNETPPRACLADFGLSTLTLGRPEETTVVDIGDTPIYMAPELLHPTKFGKSSMQPTQPADIYAFGMVIYEVLAGFQPFYKQKLRLSELVYHVVCGLRPARPDNVEKAGFGDETWELVEECWTEEATRRPTIDQVFIHLKRVAAFSTVVDPTPEIPDESAENSFGFDSSSKLFVFPTRDSSHLDTQGQIQLFSSTTISTAGSVNAVSDVRPVSTISEMEPVRKDGASGKTRPGSTISVGIMLVSAALSSMILVPSMDDKAGIWLPASTKSIARRRKVSNTSMHHLEVNHMY